MGFYSLWAHASDQLQNILRFAIFVNGFHSHRLNECTENPLIFLISEASAPGINTVQEMQVFSTCPGKIAL